MPQVMVDLETLGKGNNAALVAIGAVEFNIQDKTLGKEFYEVVDLQSSVDAGGIMDTSTVLWWLRQSDEARAEFLREGMPIQDALKKFSFWGKGLGFVRTLAIWGNGATFDNTILRNAYERLGMVPPWNYQNDRCFRTVRALYPLVEITDEGTAHHALDDAKWQARYIIEALG